MSQNRTIQFKYTYFSYDKGEALIIALYGQLYFSGFSNKGSGVCCFAVDLRKCLRLAKLVYGVGSKLQISVSVTIFAN